jgi:hypothetical protein
LAGAGYAFAAAGAKTGAGQGAYLEGTYFHRLGDGLRFGIGPGVDALWPHGDLALVAYLRTSVEMFTPIESVGTSEPGRCGSTIGAWVGQLGIGGYVDVQKPIDASGISVVAGLSLRLPLVFGVATVVPHCQ